VAVLGFTLSVATNVLHFSASVRSMPVPATPVAWVIACAYGALAALIIMHLWRAATSHWLLLVTAIAVFVVSAAHLIYYAGRRESLVVDLVIHNASLPLVAALLYNEYRFALADVFLKRALSLVVLVVISSTLYVVALDAGKWIGLALWMATALIYPSLRDMVTHVVDRWILRRSTAREVRARLASVITVAETPVAVLDRTCSVLREALTAQWVSWHDSQTNAERPPSARVVVPVSEAPGYVIDVGPLAGGRRLLSGDMDLLEAVALDVARRIDAICITAERYERSARESEALRLAAEAELRALHAQLNPHFLFNALTTIGHLIREAPDRAVETLLRLTELLRAVLRRSAGELVTVREELALVESYLSIERARFEERLSVQIDVPAGVENVRILPLVIQPLVENAIKHGIAPLAAGGLVRVTVIPDGSAEAGVIIRVRDTGAGATSTDLAYGRAHGVGLANVERRIAQYYGAEASLRVDSTPGVGTMVELRLPRKAA
jgi:signal transduction histidine kinase